MNISISWSGDLSQKIAETLKIWLPTVIQSIKPLLTQSDVANGTNSDSNMIKNLKECAIGIICLTPENTDSPWILFEAGALTNKLDKSRVCPLLFDLKYHDLKGPLATFQTTVFGKEEFKILLNTINKNLGDNKLTNTVFNEVFEISYPRLEEKVNSILESNISNKGSASNKSELWTDRDILEKTLELSRSQCLKPKQREYDISKEFDKMSSKDIEFIKTEIVNYMIKNRFRYKEYSFLNEDDVFEKLKENMEIRKAAGNSNNLKTIIAEFVMNPDDVQTRVCRKGR